MIIVLIIIPLNLSFQFAESIINGIIIELGFMITDPQLSTDYSFLSYKNAKKTFAKALKAARKAYEKDQILEVVHAAEVDKKQILEVTYKKAKTGISSKASAVKGQNGKVAYEITDILDVWKSGG